MRSSLWLRRRTTIRLRWQTNLRGSGPASLCSTIPRRRPRPRRNIGLATCRRRRHRLQRRGRPLDPRPARAAAGRLDRQTRSTWSPDCVTFFDLLDQSNLSPAASSRCMTIFTHRVTPAIFRRSVFDRIGVVRRVADYTLEDGTSCCASSRAELPSSFSRRRRFIIGVMAIHDEPRYAAPDPRYVRAFALSIARRRRLGLSLAPLSFERYFETPVQES